MLNSLARSDWQFTSSTEKFNQTVKCLDNKLTAQENNN